MYISVITGDREHLLMCLRYLFLLELSACLNSFAHFSVVSLIGIPFKFQIEGHVSFTHYI